MVLLLNNYNSRIIIVKIIEIIVESNNKIKLLNNNILFDLDNRDRK